MLASIAGFSLLVAGCGGDTGTASSADTTGSTEPSAAQVATIEPGTLTVCVTGVKPFANQTDQGASDQGASDQGDWTGFDVDLLEAMATDINGGLELSVTVLPLSGIWLAPADGTCDVVAAALTITPERAEAALFTDPYFTSAQSLMVLQPRADELTSLDALSGLTIGAISGSTGAAYADANAPEGATVVGFANGDLLYAALDSGEVDAVVRDLPLNISRFNSEPGKYALVGEFDTGEQYGFAVAKGNTALADALNQQLKRVQADGTYQKIYDQYFTLVSTTTAP